MILAQAQTSAPGLEYGALGLVAMVVIYVVYRLVNWMTTTLNGKLNKIAEGLEDVAEAIAENQRATEANTVATKELIGAVKDLANKVERIDGRLP